MDYSQRQYNTYTHYDSRGRVVARASDGRELRELIHNAGFPYRDTLVGLDRTGEHAHNGALIKGESDEN